MRNEIIILFLIISFYMFKPGPGPRIVVTPVVLLEEVEVLQARDLEPRSFSIEFTFFSETSTLFLIPRTLRLY